ncbi:DEAD-box ATP-dependent RNA helicase 50 [Zea mays]|uniref:DEAD-box ATP-dependent RNA helicase 50 n=1 Tax=Zea mays TaxID=4577 RepID=A0A317YF58_MAIZE|nr:DEAD-box ATP-dependent RNA helicase 50 [Zea mays]
MDPAVGVASNPSFVSGVVAVGPGWEREKKAIAVHPLLTMRSSQNLRNEEVQGLHKSTPRNPRVIVLTPTAELASQVLNNCRLISKSGVPLRSMVATGGFRQKTQLESLDQELDVIIATPGRFLYLLQEGFVQLANLRSVVLDEVDILFGEEGFEQVLHQLITVALVTTQYIFVIATLPLDIYNKVVETFPDCEVIMGPGVHRTSSHLEEIIEESPVRKTIVFYNKIETCREVENALRRVDRKASQIKVLPFHAALDQAQRIANIKEFLNKQTTDSMFLVCTDRSGEWGDHVTLQAAADKFAAKICLLTSFRDTCFVEIVLQYQAPQREIWLSFWSEVHYNSLYDARDLPSKFKPRKKHWLLF